MKIALDVAQGLLHLHNRLMCHLDLKSPNLLLSHTPSLTGYARSLWARPTWLHCPEVPPGPRPAALSGLALLGIICHGPPSVCHSQVQLCAEKAILTSRCCRPLSTAKLADMGLARVLTGSSLLSRGSRGTYHWAAPELLLGRRVTRKADIWSFGVVSPPQWTRQAGRLGNGPQAAHGQRG